MLQITDLSVAIDNTPILKNFSLTCQPGSVHAIMGPNGSGKSTLAYTLMGHPSYQINHGSVQLQGAAITDLSPDKRAKAGIFLAFQQPLEIPGVTVATLLKEAHYAVTGMQMNVTDFNALLQQKLAMLKLDPAFAYRNVNEGFSGGEKKRLEMVQLLLLQPKLAILDEIDSGLDIDALKLVADALASAREQNPTMIIVLITHYQRMLNHVQPDYVHIMQQGTLVKSGDASLAHQLENRGYDAAIAD